MTTALQTRTPMDLEALPEATARLNDYVSEWRKLPLGKGLGDTMTEPEREAALLICDRLKAVGTAEAVLDVIDRLLAHWHQSKKKPDSLAEDWVRSLVDKPFVAIWNAYEAVMREKREFPPSLGLFLDAVQTQQNCIDRVRKSIERGAK